MKRAQYTIIRYPFSKWFILSIITIIIAEFFKNAIHFDKLFYNSLTEQLTSKQIYTYFEFQKKWEWLSYIFLPILLLIKTSISATILYIGLFFFNKDLKFSIILNFVIKAEFIFLLVPIFKVIWFTFFQINYDLNDVQNFYPISALNIIGYRGLESWLIYPFQVLNLFELFYIIYLGNQIGKLTNTNTDYGLKIVALSYVPTLFLWVVTVMFFTLNYS
ncbi:hypothetical protein [Flavobacterium sp. KACC 22761]|uniref:hypothetical protein n=1 Tax=Flavobacterium sp. KACC 22761 TaxID=3092665 RepID=UPI002A75774F|nr:hypothetical protein [Flavobacterium sp. KACC 22761]WPO79720.1 hypothetical protein SCB73_04930 [Flavobacterium sp. KACC 22761]